MIFEHLKRLGVQTLIYGMGHVFSRLIAFFLLPFLTHSLKPEEYSAYTQLYIAITVGMAVLILGLDVSLLRFYVPEKENKGRREIFSTIFWGVGGVTLVGILLAISNAEFLSQWLITLQPQPLWVRNAFILACLIMGMDILAAFPLIVLRGENHPWRYIGINLIAGILQFGLTIWLVVSEGRGVTGALEANLMSSLVRLALLFPTISGRLVLRVNRQLFREALQFGLPNVPNLLFVSMVELADRWLLGHIRGPYENGVYSAAYRLGMFLAVVATAFRFAWQPFFLSLSEKPEAKETFARTLTYYLLLILGLYVTLVAWVEPLVKTDLPLVGYIIDPQYHMGLKVFPIVLLAHIFNGVYTIFMVGVYMEKKTGILPLISGVSAGINIVGNILLMPRWGMWAAAWLTVFSWALMAVWLLLFIQPRYPIPYEWVRLVKVALIGLITTAAVLMCRHQGWTMGAILAPLIYFPLVLSPLVLTPEERQHICKLNIFTNFIVNHNKNRTPS